MVLELAQPVAFLLSILSLYSTFQAAFLVPASTFDERLQSGLTRLACAAIFSLLAGLLFREVELDADARFDAEFHAYFGGRPRPLRPSPLLTTLPVRLFCWAALGMTALFAVSWYVETYCILYRDVRY